MWLSAQTPAGAASTARYGIVGGSSLIELDDDVNHLDALRLECDRRAFLCALARRSSFRKALAQEGLGIEGLLHV
ncbi:MAG: hypothetical protein JW940_02055 [Polyangiaceae bacterium]|nr:hypothetical protein [Polyangiaceae bacterium]